jgi:shikimate kinase
MSSATLELESPAALMPATRTPSRAVPAHLHRIVLTGFMGSGKSTLGRQLAEQLGWRFVDLDREIERRAGGLTVPQIFAASGEAAFRRLESRALAALLGHRHLVLALGGGAPEQLGNRLLLEQTPHTAVVHLTAPLETLLARCRLEAADPAAVARPVLADPAAAQARFHLRRPFYERIASHTLDTSTLAPGQAAAALLDLLT